ncbi:MAG: GNAT family N-acetyltransferase [Lachnospiraceae bacterium]|nr:GNAT family N-acetyltransferase [Lachnospiraceae bacterium]
MSVTLRKIVEQDLERIMNWRMDPDITRYMNTDPVLTMEGQRKWLASIESRQDVKYWLIEVDGQPAGVINIGGLEHPEGHCTWGYYVGEKRLRSIKTALGLEMSMYDYLFVKLGKKKLYGDIFSLNQGVIQLHLMCGSEIVEEKKAHVEKNGEFFDVTFMCMTAEKWLEIRDRKKYEKIEFPDV